MTTRCHYQGWISQVPCLEVGEPHHVTYPVMHVPETVFGPFSGERRKYVISNVQFRCRLKQVSWGFFCAGTTERRGIDSVSRQEEMFRGVQVSQVQAEVDERKQLGKHGTGVHQVSHQRLPTQTGK